VQKTNTNTGTLVKTPEWLTIRDGDKYVNNFPGYKYSLINRSVLLSVHKIYW